MASFDDPHTICEYARSQPMPYGEVPALNVGDAPPLPVNFPQAPYAPEALNFEQHAGARMYGTGSFSPDDWRRYRGTYAALVERVDERIGALLEGIDLASTAVVFVSDHGDGDASHGWNQKTALHQECIRVPLLVHVPGRAAAVEHAPVPALLAVLPTLCEVAGIAAPKALSAGSVLTPSDSPVVVETVFTDAATLPGAGTPGRALILGRWKYTVYGWGQNREQLHDLAADPQEQRNLAVENAFAPEQERMRAELLHWCEETGDTAFRKRLVLPETAPAGKHQGIFRVPY
ncbi:sulfatase family protein [Arthrobacter psychrochitiniphilus]|uniref:sulfatase family protein n=1 Tax=Arthrobacter psychrochitiniphilus TaxID=291045 RepID=UPI003F7BA78C